MAALSSSRTRRSRSRTAEATRQVLVFQLQHEWFALPIEAVQKVVVRGDIYGDPNHSGVSLTVFEGRELVVVDVAHRIFNRPTRQQPATINSASSTSFLVIVRDSRDEWVGLPIQNPPAVRRLPESAFAPLPASYQSAGNIHCVSSLTIQRDDEPPIFLLDRDRLVAGTLATLQ